MIYNSEMIDMWESHDSLNNNRAASFIIRSEI